MIIHPDSGGTAELGEVGWSDAARAAAVAARRMKMRATPRRPTAAQVEDDGERERVPPDDGHEERERVSATKPPSRPKRSGETKNDRGERVIQYTDGSTVTVHAGGTATHVNPQGISRTGRYRDPQPKKPNIDPEGFSTPKARQPAPLKGRKRSVPRPPRPARLVRAKLSRTKKGPVAGSL